ncbi:MAG TPA: glycosyltransferase family 2 protein [Polyangia bacterium]|jgi:cellulose synthase/poly-beta-1,6-N-acetylglucosamine synthase-like glycosyltransferase|nr:glycosyltransferase family 2 protein [Polyangia bacterium]
MIAALVMVTIALLAYTYVGYPIVIGVLARLSPLRLPERPIPPDAALPTITVCLPVWNGAALLPAKLDSLLAQDYPAEKLDIIVYCDGCSDDTEAGARRIAAQPRAGGRITVQASTERLGKPTAINKVRGMAKGELLLLNDARQPLSPNSARALAAPFRHPEMGCTTGNLVLTGGAGSGVYWRYENWIRRQESRFRSVVGMSGSIAMVRRDDLSPLPADIVLDDVWIPMQLRLRGRRVLFVTEAEAYDSAFEDDQEFRRKVRTLAGNYQLFAMMPALLVPLRNPAWFETVSHKLMRLIAPWLLLSLAAASLVGALRASGFCAATLALLCLGQAGFYGAALVGQRAGRLAGVARTFVVLNAAAVVGLWRHLTGGQRITW